MGTPRLLVSLLVSRMTLTKKGKKILQNMYKTYKTKEKSEQVFYDMIREGEIKGAERKKRRK